MYTKTPPKDLQKAWHEFVGKEYTNKNIESVLDIGAGWGKSKERLQNITENVVTQDINRALMTTVDIVDFPEHIESTFDLVTSFDVIEHIPVSIRRQWIFDLFRLSNEYIFITTPNGKMHTQPWHFSPNEFLSIVSDGLGVFLEDVDFEYFIRMKSNDKDIISNVQKDKFLAEDSYALGLCLKRMVKRYWRRSGYE